MDSVRVDKWLWAARWYKTRSLATAAVDAGKVELDGARLKPSRSIRVGDTLTIDKPPYTFIVEVTGLAEKRGSAQIAAGLYCETDASAARRAEVAAGLKIERSTAVVYEGRGRPTKKDRRELMKFVRKGLAGPGRPGRP